MTKRVLAFLLVLALVVSLVPTVVLAEEAAATPGYTVVLQKAHNQTENAASVDIYLQANTADQAAVTGYDFTVTPAEGLIITDVTGSVAFSSETNKVVYSPENPAITVGTDKVLVTTITVAGESIPAQFENALTLSDITITEAEGFWSDDAADAATEGYKGAVTQSFVPFACTDHACGHGEGTWTAFAKTSGTMAAGNYYLTSDVALTGKLDVAENAEVTICLNGYDMTTSANTQMFFLTKNNATLNICDCTATGTGADYTAGKLQPVYNHGGALRADYAGKGITINFFGGIIDGTNSTKKESSVALIYADNTLNMLGGKVQNFDAGLTSGGQQYGPIIIRGDDKADGVANISDVTFVNCGSAIVGAGTGSNGAPNAAVATLKNVTILDSAEGANAVAVESNGYFKSVTIEGNCRFDAPVYLEAGQTVTLNLGAEADVNITTASELTEEQFNEAVKMAEGGSLTAGTLLYETVGVFVDYVDGKFTFAEGHIHKGISFKAWDKTDSLPKSGNWYLLHDVHISTAYDVASDLNLDLNGKTVTAEAGTRMYNVYVAKFGLYDSTATYDEDGNWVSAGTGKITGFDRKDGGVILLQTGATMNMYGGSLTENNTNNGIIYMYNTSSTRKQNGAVFNMYGGEISNNTSTVYGAAISTNDFGDVPEGKNRAKLNIYGGKISDNTTLNADGTNGQGTIRAVGDLDITMSGGEISGNNAMNGAAFYMSNDATLTITGGKLLNNSTTKEGGAIYMCGTTVADIAADEVSGNSASNGGAIFVTDTAELTVDGGVWKKNTAISSAGAIYVFKGTASISNAKFTEHAADVGGVLYTNNAAVLTVENCQFQDNNTTSSCGVVYVNGSSNATFKDCLMSGNSSGSNASAIRVGDKATLTLDSTVITENYTTDGGVWACGAIYHVGATQKVILKGATVIAGNTSKQNPLSADYVFQGNNNTPTVYVNELTDGAHVNIYNMSADKRAAADLVQIADGGSQTEWDCGWISYYESTGANNNSYYVAVTPKTVSRNNEGEFVFGHWHNVNGTMVEYTAVGTQQQLNSAAANGYYYLTSSFTMGNWGSGYSWRPNNNVTLCLNGYVVTATADHAIGFTATTARTVTIQDCTGYYNLSDEYVGGGFTSTKTTRRAGAGIHYSGAAHTVNWEGGKLFGFTVLNDGAGETSGALVYMPNNISANLNIKGGAFCDNLSTDESAEVTAKNKVSLIQMNSGKLNITGGHFYRNQNLTLTTGTAHGGVIRVAGGTLSVKNAKFFDNVAGTRGGAISADMAAGISDTVFRNNTAQDGNGGAIYFSNTGTITNCTFENNSASGKGGAVFINGNGNSTMTNSTFTDNNGSHGGAVAVNCGQTTADKAASATTVTINGCAFEGNTATTDGGAVYAAVNTHADKGKTNTLTLNIKNGSSFIDNEATAGAGGAVRTVTITDSARAGSATPTLKVFADNSQAPDCLFESNSAAANGGAVYAGGASEYSDCNFIENEVTGMGGAVFTESSSLKFTRCDFTDNKATSAGGAVRASNGNGVYTVTDCQFVRNTAGTLGGAMNIESGKTLTVLDSNFDSNSAGTYGGAICTRGNGMTANVGKTEDGTGCTFINNSAKNGGAIAWDTYNRYTNTRNVDSSVFTGNYASSTGGAMFISCGSHASNTGALTAGITNCTIENNGAGSAGAALGIQGYTNANLSNTTIQNNKDYSTYGAIYLGNDYVNLTLSGKLIIKDNKGTTYPDADIVLRGDANPNPHLIVANLDPESQIGIQASNARYESDPVMTKETITLAEGTTYEQINDCFFSNAPARFRTYVTAEGQLILTNYVAADGTTYQTLAEAVAAAIANGETKVTVQAGTSIDKTPVAVTEDLMIDLNGFDVTKIVVSEGKELKLIDSATNDYTSENAGSAVVEGDYSFYAEDNTNGLKRYVVLENEDGTVSAHRVYLAITTKVLRPTNNGVGFKAIFAGSDVITENQDMFGIEISTTADFAKTSTGFFTEMTAGIEGTSTPNQKTIILRDVLKEGMDNATSYNTEIFGRPYIVIGEEVVYGTTVSTTMSDLVDAALKSNDATVVEAVNAMLAQFGMSK